MFSCTFFILSLASLNKGSASSGKFSCSPFSFPFVANVAFRSRSPKGDLLSSPLFSLSMDCKHNEVFDMGLCWNLSDIFQVWVSSPDFKCSLKNFLLWTTWSHNEPLSSNKLTLKKKVNCRLCFFFFNLLCLLWLERRNVHPLLTTDEFYVSPTAVYLRKHISIYLNNANWLV